jgi:hypothetical protein
MPRATGVSQLITTFNHCLRVLSVAEAIIEPTFRTASVMVVNIQRYNRS